MKRHHPLPSLPLLAALLLASACSAPKDISIVVSSARAPGDKCDFSDATLYVEGGSVDLSALGAGSSFFQVFSWENTLQQISTTVNGDTIAGPTVNMFVANRIELSYILVGAAASPPAGIINISAAIAAGATPDKNSVGIEMLTQEAVNFLLTTVPVGGATETLLVTFQVAGALVGGSAAATNLVTFPLTVYACGNNPNAFCNAPLTLGGNCPTGFVRRVTSCGVPGRDVPLCSQ